MKWAISLIGFAAFSLAVLKLLGTVSVGWLWVVSPIWMALLVPFALVIAMWYVATGIATGIGLREMYRNWRVRRARPKTRYDDEGNAYKTEVRGDQPAPMFLTGNHIECDLRGGSRRARDVDGVLRVKAEVAVAAIRRERLKRLFGDEAIV